MCRGKDDMEANINLHQKEVNFPVFNILILSFGKKKNFKELRQEDQCQIVVSTGGRGQGKVKYANLRWRTACGLFSTFAICEMNYKYSFMSTS